jgi:hypothetical protein
MALARAMNGTRALHATAGEARRQGGMSWIADRARAAADDAHRRVAEAEAALARMAEQTKAAVGEAPAARAAEVQAKVEGALSRIEASAPHQANLLAAVKNLPSRARSAVGASPTPPAREDRGLDVKTVARPGAVFVAGVGTGLVSGNLGLPGAAAQTGIDAAVDARGTAQDKFCFGLGQVVAGAYHAAAGGGKIAAAGAAEVATVGVATPGAAPVALDGVAELAAGVSLITGGTVLMSRGAPPEIAPVEEPRARTPAGYDDRHITGGEIKYSASGRPEAQGFHLEGAHAEGKARVVKGTRTRPDARGVYKGAVEVKDPRTGQWVRKRRDSTFFPEGWDRQRVRREVMDAYANRTELGDGVWTGTSRSGMEINGFVDNAGRITSAYPAGTP